MSEILAEHKKILPQKYDRKGQPNVVGSEELPFPICITPAQLKGSHHFHLQHGPYSRRFVMVARNSYSKKLISIYNSVAHPFPRPWYTHTAERHYFCLLLGLICPLGSWWTWDS